MTDLFALCKDAPNGKVATTPMSIEDWAIGKHREWISHLFGGREVCQLPCKLENASIGVVVYLATPDGRGGWRIFSGFEPEYYAILEGGDNADT